MDIGREKFLKLGGFEVRTNNDCLAYHLEKAYLKNETEQGQRGYEGEIELW